MLVNLDNLGHLVFLFKHILQTYFTDDFCIAVIYNEDDVNLKYQTETDFLYGLEQAFKFENDSVQRMFVWIKFVKNDVNMKLKIAGAVKIGCQSYITVLNDEDNRQFIETKLLIKEYSQRRGSDNKMLMVLDGDLQDIDQIFDINEINFYPNLLVMWRVGEIYEFYSHQYNGIPKARKEILLVDYFFSSNRSFAHGANLYPDKLFNLQASNFLLGSITYLPYVVIKEVDPGKGNCDQINDTSIKSLQFDGIESIIMLEFCRLRNCTLKLQSYGLDEWGDILDNGTSYGLLGAVYQKEVEFVIGSIYSWNYEQLDLSEAIAKSAIVLMVPRALPISKTLTPIYPFSLFLWLTLGLFLIILILSHYFISKRNVYWAQTGNYNKPSIESSTFEIISVLLSQSYLERTKQSSDRLILACILILGLLIGYSYSGALASVLTVPKYEPFIDTVHQFVEHKMQWGSPSYAWVFSITAAEDHDTVAMVKSFKEYSHDDLFELPLQRKLSVGVERLNGGNYGFGSYIQEESIDHFDMMKEELYFDYTVGCAQRGWPLMPYFNKLVLEVLQHGLYDIWERRTVNHYLNYKVQAGLHNLAIGHRSAPPLAPLTVQHISGALFIFTVGLAVAVVVLLLELKF